MYIKREQELNSYEIFSFVFQAFLNILGNCMQAQYKHTPVKVNGESIQMHVYKNKKKLIGAFFGEETSSLQQLIDTVPKS